MTTTEMATAMRLSGAAAGSYRAHLDQLGPLPGVPAHRLIAMTADATVRTLTASRRSFSAVRTVPSSRSAGA